MINDYVIFNDECKAKIIEGVNLAAKVVSTTFGPNASNCVISSQSGIHISKDGSTCLNSIFNQDPYVQIGVNLMKKLSARVADKVGDGSTTCVILANAIVNQFKDEKNPIALTRELQSEVSKIIDYLETHKKEISNKEDLINVASLSANNDRQLGELIANAFDKVGKDGIVTFKEGTDVTDKIEVSKGFRITNGFTSSKFANTPAGECVLENVLVHISDTKINYSREDLLPIAEEAMNQNKSLLLIAPEYDDMVNFFLKTNMEKGLLNSCTVISPEFRNLREIAVKDLRALLGESKTCERVVITSDSTTFIGCNGNQELIDKYVKEAKEIVEEGSRAQLELDFHRQRIANFTAGIATIYVGGYSEVEIKEKLDRVEDAVRATQAALQGGILPGGGCALYNSSKKANQLKSILHVPTQILRKESGERYYSADFWLAEDYKNEKIGNAIELGIIEPFLVTKEVLEDAVSTASMILTCNCAIINF